MLKIQTIITSSHTFREKEKEKEREEAWKKIDELASRNPAVQPVHCFRTFSGLNVIFNK